jgi:site-specific DNA-methyltransferase (adenine-specific)
MKLLDINKNVPVSHVECCDNMEFMSRFPDGFFDLAPEDPPYGIKEDGRKKKSGGNGEAKAKDYKGFLRYDDKQPDQSYFDEVFRVSKKQMFFGENYLQFNQKRNSSGRLIWDKINGSCDFADCELAWVSFINSCRIFRFMWNGMLQGKSIKEGNVSQGNNDLKEIRIHPNQKPVALYAWILQQWAKPGYKILDANMGSQSLRIACYKLGFDYYGCDSDPYAFKIGCDRFEKECNGIVNFNNIKTVQKSLF